jgi:hypothetical protein
MRFEIILLIIFLVAVPYFLIDYAVLLNYTLCGPADMLMPFKDENKLVHDYFCHSI